MNTNIYLINHTTKEYAYVGNGDNNGINWVFKDHYWRPNDKISITCNEKDIPGHFMDVLKPVDHSLLTNSTDNQPLDKRFPSFF